MCRSLHRSRRCKDRIKCQNLAKHITNQLPTVDLSSGLPGRFVSNPTVAHDSSAADLCFPGKDWEGTGLGGGMRQGLPFETNTTGGCWGRPAGAAIGPALAYKSLAPLPRQVLCTVLAPASSQFADHLASPASFKSICGRLTAIKHSLPKVLQIQQPGLC